MNKKCMVITEPGVPSARLLGLGSKAGIPATCSANSTKIFLDLCRVVLMYAKMEQVKERLFWQQGAKE